MVLFCTIFRTFEIYDSKTLDTLIDKQSEMLCKALDSSTVLCTAVLLP